MSRPTGSKNKPKDGQSYSLYRGMARTEAKANIAQNLNDTKARSGWTVPELVARASIKSSTIYSMLAGTHAPNTRTLWKLCTALGCTPNWILIDHSGGTAEEAFQHEGAPNTAFVDVETLKAAHDRIKKVTETNLYLITHQSANDKVRVAALLEEINQDAATSTQTGKLDLPTRSKNQKRLGEANFLISKVLGDTGVDIEGSAGPTTLPATAIIPTKEATSGKREALSKRINTLLAAINQKPAYLCSAGLSYTGASNIVKGNVWPTDYTFNRLATLFHPLTVEQLKGDPISLDEIQNLQPKQKG